MAANQGGSPSMVGRWDDFSQGHWGSQGSESGHKGLWGGQNMLVTREGAVAPAPASRPLTFTNLALGEVFGVHWAWGVDGRVYFVQENLGEGGGVVVRRFTPSLTDAITVEDVTDGAYEWSGTRKPAWADFSGKVYLSLYGDKVYAIDPTANTATTLTGGGGDVAGGRTLVLFGERLMVAGFPSYPQRVNYSEPADVGNFPALNFFDLGADQIEVAGLYVMLDVLVGVLSDQQIWSFRGVPGGVSTLRRVYGYHAASGGVSQFVHDNATVDPSQTRLWMFDHTARALARFNGGSFARIPGFGITDLDRQSTDDPDGIIVATGGPEDLLIDRIPVPRTAGRGAAGERNELIRVNNAFALVDQDVLTGPSA